MMLTSLSARLRHLDGGRKARSDHGVIHPGVLQRLSLLILLGVSETVLEMVWKVAGPGGHTLVDHPVVNGGVAVPAFRFVVFFVSTYATFAIVRIQRAMSVLSAIAQASPVSAKLLACHFMAVLTFLTLPAVFGALGQQSANVALTGARILCIVLAFGFGATAVLPLRGWLTVARAAGKDAWVYSVLLGALVNPIAAGLWALSTPLADMTFRCVCFILRPFLPTVESDAASRSLAADDFAITVDPSCSGIEGMVLMFLFGVCWLVVFRRNYRFPNALALLPLAIFLSWILNSLRIASLLFIGASGAPDIALSGFHSQAGWVAFVAVSLGVWGALGRLPIFGFNPKNSETYVPAVQDPNFTAVYLAPLMAIVAASMLSRAASADFEWLYPARFFAAAAALWVYRSFYGMKCSAGWSAPLTGLAVSAIWLAMNRIHEAPSMTPLPAELANLSRLSRVDWIACRMATSCIAEPIAEELAFRGFLARRLVALDFERVSYHRLSITSVVISSLVFGVFHGERWESGILAGLAYGVLVRRTGQLGDAVVAHATTNLLVAVSALTLGRWDLW